MIEAKRCILRFSSRSRSRWLMFESGVLHMNDKIKMGIPSKRLGFLGGAVVEVSGYHGVILGFNNMVMTLESC